MRSRIILLFKVMILLYMIGCSSTFKINKQDVFQKIIYTEKIQPYDVFQKVLYANGNFFPRSINQTLDHGAVIGGVYIAEHSKNYTPFLLKLNQDWSVAWSRAYGKFNAEYVTSTKVCDDGTYVTAGTFNNNIYLLKVDQSGDIMLSKILKSSGSKVVRTICRIGHSGFIIGGRWNDDAFLIRVDQEFKPVWVNIFGGRDADHIYACQAISDSYIVVAGYTMSYGRGDADVFLANFNMSGQLQWAEAIGSSSKEAISGENCLAVTHDGSIIMTGYINDPPNGAGAAEVILVKVDKTGELEWAQTYGGENNDYGFMVQETNDYGFIINGYTTSYSRQNSDNDGFLIKTNENGILDWFKIYGTDNSEVTGFGYQDYLNGFIFSGELTDLDSQHKQIYLVRTDGRGFSGSADKMIETSRGKPELVVTPIQNLEIYSTTLE